MGWGTMNCIDDTKAVREEIGRKGISWAAQEIAVLRRLLAEARTKQQCEVVQSDQRLRA